MIEIEKDERISFFRPEGNKTDKPDVKNARVSILCSDGKKRELEEMTSSEIPMFVVVDVPGIHTVLLSVKTREHQERIGRQRWSNVASDCQKYLVDFRDGYNIGYVMRHKADIPLPTWVSKEDFYLDIKMSRTGMSSHMCDTRDDLTCRYNSGKHDRGFIDHCDEEFRKTLPEKIFKWQQYFPLLGAVSEITEEICGQTARAYVPSFEEMEIVNANLDKIQEVMKVCGGKEIPVMEDDNPVDFWTANEVGDTMAMVYCLGGQFVDNKRSGAMIKCMEASALPLFRIEENKESEIWQR